MFYCNKGDSVHTHANTYEIELCWGWKATFWVTPIKQGGLSYVPPKPKPVAAPPGAILARYSSVCPTCKDTIHAEDIIWRGPGSSWICDPCRDATLLTRPTSPSGPVSSAYAPPSTSVRPMSGSAIDLPAPTHPVAPGTVKSMFAGPFLELLEKVPDGNFAVREEEGAEVVFMRLSRPVRGKYMNCIKVQTQHAEARVVKWVRWDSGRISIYSNTIEEKMLLLITSYKEAARLYAQALGRCARCNTELTDERSRWIGVGPECEKYWSWILDDRRSAAEEAGEDIKY